MAGRVFVAMSGGVDSAVAALLLKQAGYDVVGVHMSLWCEQKQGIGAQRRPCCGAEDASDAESVCRRLGVPFYVLNLQREFQAHVVEYFCREYRCGRTPNPCLACNRHIKFDLLLRKVLSLGAAYLATGHYARVERGPQGWRLLRGADPSKDQSYFLYMLGQRELPHLLFPVGGLAKAEVRRLAAAAGLPVAGKPDSVEVCFVPGDGYRAFLAGRTPLAPGDIVDCAGVKLGRHAGLAGYTVGQRHGIGLHGGPWYVVGFDVPGNRLVVGPEDALYSDSLVGGDAAWVAGQVPRSGAVVEARIRYRSAGAAATVFAEADSVTVRFEAGQRAVTPGQAVVFYSGDEVLGGATIERPGDRGQRECADPGRREQASGARV